MVGLVIVSHSEKIAEGLKELAGQMATDVSIAAAGGTNDGRLGTDAEKIITAINEVYTQDGVLVLFDIGSAYMSADIALECLSEEMREKVEILDTALVEGTITAAIECSLNKSLTEIKEELKSLSIVKMPQ
ncbi:dihydroxyacetone kinase phosphoryl donor subunit DhaM [Anaerocolumna aminovalerica]|uniref:dihydroxyacetone kinase phosphoryl donor subunit DhaM n=1 Tax=Anaerocolumna aminovalerica TaxID=1527 RepID=UPI000BE2474F|nr:dihydroxyacetone kinase phosphoryl donor subunit DhaM [Anaerocolumna aminovalerica]